MTHQCSLLPETMARGVHIPQNARQAAVLLPLCTINSEPCILFTLRSNAVPSHRNEVCFPGGHLTSPPDRNLQDCALREFEEELGISSHTSKVEIVGQMPW